MGSIFGDPNSIFGSLGGVLANPYWSEGLSEQKKRKAFFSFHFNDIMRVNVVRKAWTFHRPETLYGPSFYDSSLWERRQLESPDSLKRLIREGVQYTSAVCVLIGTNTWSRRWVRYEIARAVIDNRGLLAIHINGIRHHTYGVEYPRGLNPLEFMGVGKVQKNRFGPSSYYLFEFSQRAGQWGWYPYQDHTNSVCLPAYLSDPAPGYVMQLSTGTTVRDYINHSGFGAIGSWINLAAQVVGR